jgi:hypothetical protein
MRKVSDTCTNKLSLTLRVRLILRASVAAAVFSSLVGCQRSEPSSVSAPASSAAGASSTPPPASAVAVAAPSPPPLHIGSDTPPTQPAPPDECKRALEVLDTCAYETTCNADMTLYLPSTARSQLGYLSKKPWFGSAAFAKYCEAVCNAKSPDVSEAKFADEVCGASLPRIEKPRTSKSVVNDAQGLSILIGGDLLIADQPVPLKGVLRRLGQPSKIAKSKFECSSAFESDSTMEYTFADAGFEVNGQQAVLRWARIGPMAIVTLPTVTGVLIPPTQDALASLPGYAKLATKPGALRLGVKPGADLSRAFDFKFIDGRLDRIELWIGC